MNAHDYNITIRHVTVDGQDMFEARIQELPDVAEFAETAAETYDLAIDTIETLAEIHAERGRNLPEPRVPTDEFSGRVTLRLPKDLHRSLAVEAERQDISLNQYLVSALAFHRGAGFGDTSETLEGWRPSQEESRKQGKTRAPRLRVVHSDTPQTADGWK